MRKLLFIICIILFPIAPEAQEVNSHGAISAGSGRVFSHRASDTYKFISYDVYLPSGSIGILGFQRMNGSGDHDIRVGTSIRANDYTRASMSGVVAVDDSDDSQPDFLLFADDSFSADHFYIEAWSYDNEPGEWRVRYSTFNIPEQAVQAALVAGGQMLLECVVIGCDSTGSDVQRNVGRAMNLGMSVLTRNNVCSMGTDVIMNEVATELDREFPNNRFLFLSFQQFIGNFAAKVAYVTCP